MSKAQATVHDCEPAWQPICWLNQNSLHNCNQNLTLNRQTITKWADNATWNKDETSQWPQQWFKHLLMPTFLSVKVTRIITYYIKYLSQRTPQPFKFLTSTWYLHSWWIHCCWLLNHSYQPLKLVSGDKDEKIT